jgi:hypothetical protein
MGQGFYLGLLIGICFYIFLFLPRWIYLQWRLQVYGKSKMGPVGGGKLNTGLRFRCGRPVGEESWAQSIYLELILP